MGEGEKAGLSRPALRIKLLERDIELETFCDFREKTPDSIYV